MSFTGLVGTGLLVAAISTGTSHVGTQIESVAPGHPATVILEESAKRIALETFQTSNSGNVSINTK
jgi:hypothetical protein